MCNGGNYGSRNTGRESAATGVHLCEVASTISPNWHEIRHVLFRFHILAVYWKMAWDTCDQGYLEVENLTQK